MSPLYTVSFIHSQGCLPLTHNITAIYMPWLCNRCEIDACGRILVLAVDANILHVTDQVSLLILSS